MLSKYIKKKKRERNAGKKNPTDSAKTLLLFFCLSVRSHRPGHLDLGKKSQFQIFTGYCIFTDFLQKCNGDSFNLLTRSSIIVKDSKGKKKKKKTGKKLTLFVNLKGTLIWGREMFVMFAHLSFPLETGSPI